MGLLNFFIKSRKRTPTGRSRDAATPPAAPPSQVQKEVETLRAHIHTINIALKRHDDQLAAHGKIMRQQAQGLELLVQRIDAPAASPAGAHNEPSPSGPVDSPVAPRCGKHEAPQRLDVDDFTEQEKRIIEVFFRNKDSWLSYARVGEHLSKSAHTVKNQMRQIRHRVDLFERRVGRQSRNLFKLKDDLRIEKYLHVGQPIERPLPTPRSDKSSPSETHL